ncbi:MAG: hypothetical protein K1W27_05255 [Lachnospiraceae bacterium]|jgi:hypothetical protein|nr:hypothetical protein C804_00361 [Lachnospiraceae bacterium A4]
MNKNKVLVQLCIPVTGVSFDFLLPRTLSVIQATQLISGFFTGMTGGAYMPDDTTVLCSMEDGKMYNVNSSVEELHLKNGSKLMLI